MVVEGQQSRRTVEVTHGGKLSHWGIEEVAARSPREATGTSERIREKEKKLKKKGIMKVSSFLFTKRNYLIKKNQGC